MERRKCHSHSQHNPLDACEEVEQAPLDADEGDDVSNQQTAECDQAGHNLEVGVVYLTTGSGGDVRPAVKSRDIYRGERKEPMIEARVSEGDLRHNSSNESLRTAQMHTNTSPIVGGMPEPATLN
ncbi:hypothetical protein BBJ28_00006324 [Nothophytophthora sp. Chile5]|nr:hypothetical protein BBJ28_00006324 [Nothophytophthora sp. Chile5]